MNLKNSPLFAESWNVAWREKPEGSILDDRVLPFRVIKNSKRYWAADPFVFSYNNKTYIFAELYDYLRCRGVIGYCELSEKRTVKWKPVIIEPHHLSFPYIYTSGESVYIMPESNYANELCLYRAIAFPDRWKKIKVLRSDSQFADTVLLSDEYALTYNVANSTAPELWLLDLDNGKDRKINLPNVELRRPAGKVLKDSIRCAQNCTADYGKGLVFYRYQIHNGKYDEEEIMRLFPQDIKLSRRLFLDGMHTYNSTDKYEVIDIKTRRFNIINLLFRAIYKLRKKLR